jgi:predicted DNA-binding transcriptional regulator AlpA
MPTSELLGKKYLNEKEVAAITGRAVSTLRNERFLRKGLPYLKIGGRSVRYLTKDVIHFMESRRIEFDCKV